MTTELYRAVAGSALFSARSVLNHVYFLKDCPQTQTDLVIYPGPRACS